MNDIYIHAIERYSFIYEKYFQTKLRIQVALNYNCFREKLKIKNTQIS